MPTIKNNEGDVVEITQEQYDELFGKSGKAWRAEKGGIYWLVDSIGGVAKSYDRYDRVSNYRYLTGNYFRTEAEAIAHKALQEATGRVTHAIKEANGDWEPVWGEDTNCKDRFSWTDEFDFEVDSLHFLKVPLTLPYMKPGTAEKILEEHEEDLRVIFGVK